MKILLVNPPLNRQAHLPGTARVQMDYHDFAPPIGLMYLKSYVRENSDFEIKLVNFQTPKPPSMSDFLRLLEEYRPQVVGITVMSWFWYHAVEVAKAVKSLLPDTVVVAGGAHIRVYPGETLSRPEFDVSVVGEGEITFLELLRRLEARDSLEGLAGAWFRQGDRVVGNPPRPVEKDPDVFPFPDRSDFDRDQHQVIIDRLTPSAVMLSGRGCPNMCTFCQNYDRVYRRRRASSVVDEVLLCKEMGYASVDLYDDNFNQSTRHVEEFCKEMLARKVNMPWMCRCRVNRASREMFKLMREAGCERIHFGLESANQDILDQTRKGITVEQCREAIAYAKEAGISTLAYFIIGFPDETLEEAKKTISFALELDPDYIIIHPLIPLPGTPIYERAVQDPRFGGDYLREFALEPSPGMAFKVWPTVMSEEQILGTLRRALLRFYFRPRRVARFLKELTGPRDLLTKTYTAFKLLQVR